MGGVRQRECGVPWSFPPTPPSLALIPSCVASPHLSSPHLTLQPLATPSAAHFPTRHRTAAPRQGGSLLEARAENTLHGISDHLIFNYDKNAIMRRVYLKSQFNSAANPLVFVLTRWNSLVRKFYGKLWGGGTRKVNRDCPLPRLTQIKREVPRHLQILNDLLVWISQLSVL